MQDAPLTPVEKLRIALELCDTGVALHRQNLRRRHPNESDAPIEARLTAWIQHRPGAEHGDCGPGKPWLLPEDRP